VAKLHLFENYSTWHKQLPEACHWCKYTKHPWPSRALKFLHNILQKAAFRYYPISVLTCPSTAALSARPQCATARRNRCKEDLNSFPLENWRRPSGCPRTTWMKTIQQYLESFNLSLNKAIDMAQNGHSGD